MGDVLHMDAARSQIGCDQNAIASLLKSGECRSPLGLRAVAVNHGSGEAFAIQVLGQPFGSPLGAREHQAAASFFRQQAM